MTTALGALPAALEDDVVFQQLAAGSDVCFELAIRGGERTAITVGESGDDPAFAIELDEAEWSALLAPRPEPRRQHVLAFLPPRGTGLLRGSSEAFAQHLHLVRRAIEVARGAEAAPDVLRAPLDDVAGRYLRIDVTGWGTCDVFVESVGNGAPVLLLATAGADTRQWHGIFGQAALTARHRLIAFDLPWHGKSAPAFGRHPADYTLDAATYTETIVRVIDALGLDAPPVLVGASMAGAAVVETAARHPEMIAGAVSCQAAPSVSNRHTPWLRSARVNQTLHVPEWTYGLMSPHSPRGDRDRTWWGYSQGGFGVYERDIAYYTGDWDAERLRPLLDSRTPPIAVLNGVYDYSVPPERSAELASMLPDAVFRTMPELGHFPHAEHPEAFAEHLRWALDWVAERIRDRQHH